MTPVLSVHRSATALLAANLGLGLLPFLLLAICHPAIHGRGMIPMGIGLASLLAAALLISPRPQLLLESGPPPARRALACLLLGASLAGIPWKQHGLPLANAVIATGFGIRWLLFTVETLELRNADQHHLPLPCPATRIRRACTLVTGAVIPLLLLVGFPCLPLLWISFLLTLFCQWTIGGETFHSLANHRLVSSLHPKLMNTTH